MNYRFYKVYNSLIFYQIKIKLISKRQLANTKIQRMEDMKENFNRDRSDFKNLTLEIVESRLKEIAQRHNHSFYVG